RRSTTNRPFPFDPERPTMFEPMRYAALFGALGIGLAAAAFESAAGGAVGAARVLAAAEGYVAICLFAMALAYGLHDRGVAVEGMFAHHGGMLLVDLLLLPY